MPGRDRTPAARRRRAWCIASRSAICSGGPAPTTSSITACEAIRDAPSRRAARRLFLVVRRQTARASATSSPMATPSCCSPPRAPRCVGHPDADAAARRHHRSARDALLGAAITAPAPRNSARTGRRSRAYRGQNANMHLTEALMAAFEATGERALSRQGREHRRSHPAPRGRRATTGACPNIITDGLDVDRDYKGSDMFRPYGDDARPRAGMGAAGAAILGARRPPARLAAGRRARGCSRARSSEGWDETRGGLYYTLEWSGAPRVRDRLWWPCCEGIGAAPFSPRMRAARSYEDWYRAPLGFRRRAI